jgi:hypothetical protein
MSKNEKETKTMKNTKRIFAVLIGLLVLGLGTGFAVEARDFTLVHTALLPQSSSLAMALQFRDIATPASSISLSAPIPAPSALPLVPLQESQRLYGNFGRMPRTGKALFTTSLVTMTALNIVDYFSTKAAIRQTGLKEGNPLMKPFVKNAAVFAAVKAGTTVLSVWGLKRLYKRDKTTAWVLSTVSNFLLSYVVANNMRLIRQTR